MVQLFRFHVQSLSVGKYYTSLLKSHICTYYCCINKEINILHYDGNQVNVFDNSRKAVMAAPLSCYCLHYDVIRSSISDRGCELRSKEFQIYFPNI